MAGTSVKGGREEEKEPLQSPPSHQSQFREDKLDLGKVSGKKLLAVLLSLESRSSLENLSMWVQDGLDN